MASSSSSSIPLLLLPALLALLGPVRSDFASDRAECANQLMGLATCLSYMQGNAKAPTPDCCSGFGQIVEKSFKCLCILVKDRNEPGLGIKFNVTLALLLPSKCNNPANVSSCPRVLDIPPDSPEAKMFKQLDDEIKKTVANDAKARGSQDHSTVNASGEKEKSSMNGSGESSKRMSMSGVVFLFMLSALLLRAL
ncbi:protein YLS3-like [Canna indica]|uniref:Protein YLS3-like n=1 Tax=Canna indica TaxID=4628 RepID=A0AAQ3JVY0_9LILI|nr:protein YLS3-like [Canna indica]